MTLIEESKTEPGRTLDDDQPRTLGVFDHFALWGNLGVSLLGPPYAFHVLVPFFNDTASPEIYT